MFETLEIADKSKTTDRDSR